MLVFLLFASVPSMTAQTLQGCGTPISRKLLETPRVSHSSSCRTSSQTVGVGGSDSKCTRSLKEMVYLFPLDSVSHVASATL
eukprot:415094-Prymnesium_polylepis.1